MMWHGWGPDGWGGWLAMTLSMLVFWGGLLLLVAWAVRRFAPGPRSSDALRILEERFATGEIDREEFERRRSVLEGR